MPLFSNVEMSLILSLFKKFIEPINYSALRKITENSCLTEFNCPPMDRPDRYTEPKLNCGVFSPAFQFWKPVKRFFHECGEHISKQVN